MTLQQLRYVTAIAETGTLSEAAPPTLAAAYIYICGFLTPASASPAIVPVQPCGR